jgi:preprotein translocase subunit SecB
VTSAGDLPEHPQLATVAKLRSIVLRDLELTAPDIAIPPGLPIQTQGSLQMGLATSEDHLFFRMTMTVPGIVQIDNEPVEIFRVRSTFLATFEFPREHTYSLEDQRKYGETSALPMVYPYFRELLHNTTARAGFPGVLLEPFIYFQPALPA